MDVGEGNAVEQPITERFEVDTIHPRARDDSNHLSAFTRVARARHGRSRAPLSASRHEEAKIDNALAWGALGGIATLVLAPEMFLIGAALSAFAGYNADVD